MGSDYTTHVTAFHSPVLKCLCQNKMNGNSFVTGVGEERSIRRWIFMVLKCLLLSIGNAQLPSPNIFLQCCFQKMLKEKKNMVFSFTPFLGHKTSLNKNSQSRFLQSSSPVVQGLVCDYCVHLPLFFFFFEVNRLEKYSDIQMASQIYCQFSHRLEFAYCKCKCMSTLF